LHVDNITPKGVQEFSKVLHQVNQAWKKSRKKAKAIQIAEKMVETVNAGNSLLSVALNGKYKLRNTDEFNRDGNVKGKENGDNEKQEEKQKTTDKKIENIINELHAAAFMKKRGEAAYAEINGSVVVWVVDKIDHPKITDQKERNQHTSSLLQSISEDMYQELIGYASRTKYKIDVNKELLNKEAGIDIDELIF
jgi:hypothetical protein